MCASARLATIIITCNITIIYSTTSHNLLQEPPSSLFYFNYLHLNAIVPVTVIIEQVISSTHTKQHHQQQHQSHNISIQNVDRHKHRHIITHTKIGNSIYFLDSFSSIHSLLVYQPCLQNDQAIVSSSSSSISASLLNTTTRNHECRVYKST